MRRIRMMMGSCFMLAAAALVVSPHAFAAKFFPGGDVGMEACYLALRAGVQESDFYTPRARAPAKIESLKSDPKYVFHERDTTTCVDMVVQVPEGGKASSRKVVIRKAGTGYFAKLGPDGQPLAEGFEDGCANMVYSQKGVTVRPVAAIVPQQPAHQKQIVQVEVELRCQDGRVVARADDCIQVSTAPRYVRIPVYVQEEVIYEEAYIPPPRYVHARPRYYEPPYGDYSERASPLVFNYNRNENRNININRNDNHFGGRFRDREPRNPISRGVLTGDTGGNRILGRGGPGGNLTGGTGLGGNTGGNTGGYRILGRNP